MKLPLVHLATERFSVTWRRMAATGIGRYALWVALAALVAHLGLVPGLPGSIFTFDAINYDDPQVLDVVERSSVVDIVFDTTYYAYKPVYFLSLKVDAVIGSWFGPGGVVTMGHVGNWLLHALVAVLLTVLIADITGRRFIALAVGLLFAVHPVHVESVAWLSERKDSLSFAFALFAHLTYRWQREDGGGRFVAPAFWLVLGGLTKGTVWAYVGVIGVDELIHQLRANDRVDMALAVRRLLPLGLVAFGGVVMDVFIAITAGPGAVDHGVGTSSLIAAMAGVHTQYLLHLLVPAGLALDYAIDPAGTFGVAAILGVVLAAFAVFGLVWSLRRRSLFGALASAYWLFGLLPVNNVWPRTSVLMADRYLYIPAIGVYLLVALGLSRASWRRWALGAIVVLFGVLAIERTRTFADSETVWTDTIEKVPTSALARIQRGQELARQSQYARSLEDVDRALELRPRPELVIRARLVRCADYLGLAGDVPAEAETYLEELQFESQHIVELIDSLRDTALVKRERGRVLAEAEIFLGSAFEGRGLPALALEAFERAVEADGANGTARYDYGTALAKLRDQGSQEEALFQLQQALPLLTGEAHELCLIQLATVYGQSGDDAEALDVLRNAKRRYPMSAEVLYAEARIRLQVRAELDKVKVLLSQIRALDAHHPKAARLQADIFTAEGKRWLTQGQEERDAEAFRRAIHKFDLAVDADSNYWEAEVAAGDAFLEQGLFRQARVRYRRATQIERRLGWVRTLIAKTRVLETAWLDTELGAKGLAQSAEIMAGALHLGVSRLDFGFAPLDDELPLLTEVADVWQASEGPTKTFAAHTLLAAAHLATGDQTRAMNHVRSVLTGIGDGADADLLRAASVLFRAIVHERRTMLPEARRDYELLAQQRPDDDLPRLRLLQLTKRIAGARLRIAQGFREDEHGLATATTAWNLALDDLETFADGHPGLSSAGLSAAEAEMVRQDWKGALRRLNRLGLAFPENPSVYRGTSMVYVAQRMVQVDAYLKREMIKLASRELQKALTLDPRDIRTHMQASGLARTAGDMKSALKHARAAWRLERYRGGPAARAYATLLIGLGQKAVDGKTLEQATGFMEQARRVNPADAGSWLLEAQIVRAKPGQSSLTDAEALIYKAKELEPLDPEVSRTLADVHREMGMVAAARIGFVRRPANPAEDPAWATLGSEEQAKRATAHSQGMDRYRRQQDTLRQTALRYFDSALAHLPSVPDVDPELLSEAQQDALAEREAIQERLDQLRRSDPTASAERERRAIQVVFEDGRRLQREQPIAALDAFLEAVSLYPRFMKAHQRIVELTIRLLPGASEKRRNRYTQLGFMSLHMLDQIDVEGRLLERDLYRGELNRLVLRAQDGDAPETRAAAVAALRRYVALVDEWLDQESKKPERPAKIEPGVDAATYRRASVYIDWRRQSRERATMLLGALGGD